MSQIINNPGEYLNRLDLEMLKEQREILRKAVDGEPISEKERHLLDGLQYLCDDIFDAKLELTFVNTEQPLPQTEEERFQLIQQALDLTGTPDAPVMDQIFNEDTELINSASERVHPHELNAFSQGANWQKEKLLKFIQNDENHTEGENGNSCIDVESITHFIKQISWKI